ncbi:glycoside hydrolase family 3 C-terminal domain-containing protein [Devosia sp. XJ19-1]|uniref:Beta-D-glucoside glucohydrolase n=1 Tax=Devosia ureilytica TaxID=2952754 RepID=A0A9Q4FR05_9HYPH|nr:glycoside hydrolase family 3 C-terminal domain-containing protein [Devosia ureilytica]MCP8882385.1 glycoside hydrolase family 3 C-terminal domain-containing protein [Devosia ureilytica]MCP8885728.1 glycoside hydrolase family 3 C-terminal domain-containing protein [Devosia ureilytica]
MSSRIEQLLAELTPEEKVSLLSGEDFWSVPAVERLGIGKLRVTDGPNGARGGGSLIGGVKSASFPVGIALGATWNVGLVTEIGAALADEVKSKGAHVLLAPTVNIHRSVTNGRNFECYAEDPILSAELAVGYIKGLQGQGVSATIKHFVGNESEIERTTISSEIGERALREIYLIPFEWAVKKAGTWGVMSSYNRLNGTFTSEHNWLLSTVLRQEWGYDGIVMSDWFGSHSTAATVNAGLDLEMPGPARDRGQKLVAAVNAGEVSVAMLDQRVLAMLRLMERVGSLDDHRTFQEHANDRPEHRALIRRAGSEAAVLLKNDGILPLAGSGKIAVIGPNAKTAQIMGGGSAQLNAHYRISPWEGLATALGEDRLSFAPGCTNHRFEPVLRGTFKVEYFANQTLAGEPAHIGSMDDAQAFWVGHVADGKVDPLHFSARISGVFTPEETGEHRVGIYAAGFGRVFIDGKLIADAWTGWTKGRTFFEEGCDEVVGTINLEAGRAHQVAIEFSTKEFATLGLAAFAVGIGLPLGDAAIAQAVDAARDAETAVLFIGRNGEWDTEGSDLPGILLPGRQNELVEAVAAANPRTVVVLQTGGPIEMPWADKVAAVLEAWYPGQEAGNAIADVLTGAAEPGGRLPQTFPVRWADNPAHSQDREVYPDLEGKVRYEEGIFVGYRYYDRVGMTPLYPFGYGLGYTSFELNDLVIDDSGFESDGKLIVSLAATNTGDRPGSTVVQLYVSDDKSTEPRPVKELKAFEKLHLEPGEQRSVSFLLDARCFAWYREAAHHWLVEAGGFTIRVGQSSADLPLTGSVTRSTTLMLAV